MSLPIIVVGKILHLLQPIDNVKQSSRSYLLDQYSLVVTCKSYYHHFIHTIQFHNECKHLHDDDDDPPTSISSTTSPKIVPKSSTWLICDTFNGLEYQDQGNHIVKCTLEYCNDSSIDINRIPPSIRELQFNIKVDYMVGDGQRKLVPKLEIGSIPSSVTHLYIPNLDIFISDRTKLIQSFQQEGIIPFGVTHLHLLYRSNSIGVGSIPNSVTNLRLRIYKDIPAVIEKIAGGNTNGNRKRNIYKEETDSDNDDDQESDDQENELKVGILPTSLKVLHIDNFRQKLIPGMLPNSITHLTFTTNEHYEHKLEKGVLPLTLTHLTLSRNFGDSIEIGVLPESLCYLSTGTMFITSPIPIGALPQSLVHLKIKHFNVQLELGVLPGNLKKLEMVDYDQPIDSLVLPHSLESIELWEFNQSLQPGSIPPSVKEILFREFNQDIVGTDIFPPSIQILKLPNMNRLIKPGQLPSSSHQLTLEGGAFKKIGSDLLPESLTTLHLHSSFKKPMQRSYLPPSLTKLMYYPHSLANTEDLPDTITHLQILDPRSDEDGYFDRKNHLNYSGMTLPSRLTVLIVDTHIKFEYYDSSLLPSSLTKLSISYTVFIPAIPKESINQQQVIFPPIYSTISIPNHLNQLKSLKLSGDSTQKSMYKKLDKTVEIVTNGLELIKLSIDIKYNWVKTWRIPQTITRLSFYYDYQNFKSSIQTQLPSTIKRIKTKERGDENGAYDVGIRDHGDYFLTMVNLCDSPDFYSKQIKSLDYICYVPKSSIAVPDTKYYNLIKLSHQPCYE